MKITWFGGTTFRVHLGGAIVVVEPSEAPSSIDKLELTAGAELVVSLRGGLPSADGATWKPRPMQRLLDVGDKARPVQAWSLAPAAVVLDGDDEGPLFFVAGAVPALGQWTSRAVAVVLGPGLSDRAESVLDGSSPRLIALAGDDDEVGASVERLRGRIGDTGLLALDAGLAVEV